MVFSNTQLLWSAMLAHPPVSLRTGDIGSALLLLVLLFFVYIRTPCAVFRSCKGCIVTLDELGYLHCSYLGTTPPALTPTSQTGDRELNYQVGRGRGQGQTLGVVVYMVVLGGLILERRYICIHRDVLLESC